MENDLGAFSHQALNTVLLAVAIAVGMLFPTSIFQLIRRSQALVAKKETP